LCEETTFGRFAALTEDNMLTKREFGLAVFGLAGAAAFSGISFALAKDERKERLEQELAQIEAKSKGRLGVAVLDTQSGFRAALHGGDRFPMCSTFKFLAASAVLKRVDRGQSQLDKQIRFEAKDVVTYSPVTKDHVDTGMTLAALCEAALTQSDNTAGNMLLREIGGPAGLTTFARSQGDDMTRLDRWEVELNEAVPGDDRDTTTPVAMLNNLQQIIVGQQLSEKSRQQLTDWMLANKTGDARLRAGVPHDWKVADKTGSGERGTANDIGILWPPGRKPVLITVYLTGSQATADERSAAIAEVARAVASSVTGRGS
jgi:beta-lactamase class A